MKRRDKYVVGFANWILRVFASKEYCRRAVIISSLGQQEAKRRIAIQRADDELHNDQRIT